MRSAGSVRDRGRRPLNPSTRPLAGRRLSCQLQKHPDSCLARRARALVLHSEAVHRLMRKCAVDGARASWLHIMPGWVWILAQAVT